MISPIQPIIIAGGSGSRLWPLSREMYPKQFLKLYGEYTMLQATILRLKQLKCSPPLVVCNEEHRFMVAEQLCQIDMLEHNIILEPMGKNTAPAIALAAFYAQKIHSNNAIQLLILPADHLIKDEIKFTQSITQALSYVANDKLVAFGIIPQVPETGYGYIRCGKQEGDFGFVISEFVEKPNLETAQYYLDSGEYLWNSGMYAFKADVYLRVLQDFHPDICTVCEKSVLHIKDDLNFLRVDKSIFSTCPSESIDYAVMEKTLEGVVIPMDANWSDVGSWDSLWQTKDKDENNNVIDGDVICLDGCDNLLVSTTGLMTVVGLDNIVAVCTKDAVLIANKCKSQEVKEIVRYLKMEKRSEYRFHRMVYRPWGTYDSVDSGKRHQVKRITVKPNEKLSVQMHHHRSEHWIVVSGTAKVSIDGEEKLLGENQSVYIPLGAIHYLENPGKIPLELIEVQVGSYLGEDDIVRFEDKYGRE